MHLVLRIISEQQGELYSVKDGGTLSFIKEIIPTNFNIKTNPIKAIIISANLHFWKTVDFQKDLTEASESRGARPPCAWPCGEPADRPWSMRALADLVWLSSRPTRGTLHPTPLAEALIH